MKKTGFLLIILLMSFMTYAQVSVTHLMCENMPSPIGLGEKAPRLSWRLMADGRNVKQTAYEVRVADSRAGLIRGKPLVWSSGKVASDQSVMVPYNGAALQPNRTYYWQVKIWDQNGKPSKWSEVATWQMGLLSPSDWQAKWIGAAKEDTVNRPSPIFRKSFAVSKPVSKATLYITSQGLYEAHLNGKRVGDYYLTPGWTVYQKRIQYQAYDVTSTLTTGNQALAVALGDGWFRGHIGFSGQKNFYGKEMALLLQLEITYADGSTARVVSDESWKYSTGLVRGTDIYNGESQDARLESKGWTSPGYDDSKWGAVMVKNTPDAQIVATENEPVKRHEAFPALKLITTPKGEKVIDFGQNLVGFVEVKANGAAGSKIAISHAEVLDKEGNFYTTNLRAAKQQNEFILRGEGTEVFAPKFTFQGFRYIRLDAYPGDIKLENFTAYALYSAMKPTGSFSSSHPLINQLQHNIQWGQRGNFLDVPTDCPQRDERLGWTGDAQAFARTASFNMNVHNFFTKWLKDVALDQREDGAIPFVVPNVLGKNAAASAGWADVATIVPWDLYLAYGDRQLLEDQYESMKKWVGFMQANSTDHLWNKGFHFGDWLFYRPFDDNDGRSAVTDKYLIAQCFYAHSTQLVINAAKVLGKKEDEAAYTKLLKQVKDAFLREYMTPSGRLISSTQTAYVLALHFDMLPENLREQAAKRLAENVESYGFHLTTGFLGTPYLCHVLSRYGYQDVAYKLLLQETYPSWLYPVKMGATTIWERWDGIKPDSTFQTPGMNSFNHYAYGAIGDWLYRVAVGLDTDPSAPGYKKITVNPHIGGDFAEMKAELETYYGKASAHWKQEKGSLALVVTIPHNTSAVVHLPTASANQASEGGLALAQVPGLKVLGTANGKTQVEIGSGTYQFLIKN